MNIIRTAARIDATVTATVAEGERVETFADHKQTQRVRVSSLTLSLDGDGTFEIGGYGYTIKKDGTVGVQHRTLYWVDPATLPADLVDALLAEAKRVLRAALYAAQQQP